MWEHESVICLTDELHPVMKRYGDSGWELVSVVFVMNNMRDYRLFFKRRRDPGLR